MKVYRQGDVMLRSTDRADFKGMKKVPLDKKKVVLAYGEVTGHSHALNGTTCSLWEDPTSGERKLEVKKGSYLLHEEHSKIYLPAGSYEVIKQREFDGEYTRDVAD